MLPRSVGKEAFGHAPASYHRARPSYPDRVFDLLRLPCGAGPGVPGFEIGPGSGLATVPILNLGAQLTAIEPDARLATFLVGTAHANERLRIVNVTFEAADLPENAFAFGFAATSFHWLEPAGALAKIARLLQPGGWWLACWNVFFDPSATDAFTTATQPLFADLPRTPSYRGARSLPFGLDVAARTGELRGAGLQRVSHELIRRRIVFATEDITALYSTFSAVATLAAPARQQFLERLETIANRDFGGTVERTILTPIYWAQRPPRD